MADSPQTSLFPQARPTDSVAAPAAAAEPAVTASPSGEAEAEASSDWYDVDVSSLAPARSLRPPERTDRVRIAAARLTEERRRGAVCGDVAIQGEAIGAVAGPGACGVEGAVRVTSVAGVALSTPATIDCRTATALKTWVERGVKPAIGGEGGGVQGLRVAGHYVCRGRNNVAGARLSEHSFGRAIDISGIRLQSGEVISVLNGWNSSGDGAQLRQMHQSACGIFGTILGPDANAAHRDHFHFDTARYRSGSYCR
ncbi:extensin family protein [Pelagovum pacificum]|uniref:Extensin family protein n=2 Tax=Pelagovum pacificum TaxID=2588711 RepID=A0A5C5GDM7_9RHOB|nr:extensin family protein [Pelagovum pacificum]TNY31679.1 extensin family protein [Pelagovum pacificum]